MNTHTIYIHRNMICTSKEDMDDYIFIELSKYSEGYPSNERIAEEWEREVEEVEVTVKELLAYMHDSYKIYGYKED